VLALQVVNREVLLVFNLPALDLPLLIHLFAQASHLVLVLDLDLSRDALKFLSNLGLLRAVRLMESVSIFGMPCLLLFLLYDEATYILLELSFLNPVLIL